MKNFIEKLKVKNFINRKNIFLILLFSFLFTMFSFHLYTKHIYWYLNYPLPEIKSFNITFIADRTNNIIEKEYNLFQIKKLQNKYYVYRAIKNNVPEVYLRTLYPFYKIYNEQKLLAEIDGEIIYKVSSIYDIKSFQVNGEEIISSRNNNEFRFKVKKGEINNISILQRINSSNDFDINWRYFLSISAIITTFIIYLTLFGLLFYKISITENKKEKFSKLIKENKISIFLFMFCIMLYIVLYVFKIFRMDYFFNYNLIYSADSNVSILAIMQSLSRRFHLYYFLPFYPFFDFIFLITKNLIISLMIVFCVLVSFSAVFLEKTLNLIIPENRKLTLVLTMIFIFSYVQIIMPQTFEVYNITGFYISLLVYLVIKYLRKGGFTAKRIIILGILSALTFGVSFPNIITFLIILIPIILSKKEYKKVIILAITIILSVSLFTCLKIQTSPQTKGHIFYSKTKRDIEEWWHFDFYKNLSNFKTESLYRPLLAINVKNTKITNNIMIIFWYMFALLIIISLLRIAKNKNNMKKDDIIIYESLVLALVTNLFLNFCWCSIYGFTFCQNYFILEFYVFSFAIKYLIENTKSRNIKKKLLFGILLLFFIIEIPINIIDNNRVQNEAIEKHPMDYKLFMRD